MSHGIRLKVKRPERALERLMGVVSRRGYALEYLSAQPSRDQETFDVTLRLESGRKGDVLLRQLQNLNDVVEIHWIDAGSGVPLQPGARPAAPP